MPPSACPKPPFLPDPNFHTYLLSAPSPTCPEPHPTPPLPHPPFPSCPPPLPLPTRPATAAGAATSTFMPPHITLVSTVPAGSSRQAGARVGLLSCMQYYHKPHGQHPQWARHPPSTLTLWFRFPHTHYPQDSSHLQGSGVARKRQLRSPKPYTLHPPHTSQEVG